MKVKISPNGVKLWLSARETDEWAHRPGKRWPCSDLAGRRLFAEFDRNGLVDLAVDGKRNDSVTSSEFNACTADHLAAFLKPEHPCYLVCVGQYTVE